MVTWLQSVTLLETPDLPWVEKLTDSTQARFLVLARRFDVLCQTSFSEKDATCLRASMAQFIVADGQDRLLPKLERYDQKSIEQTMLSALAGDITYANGDLDAATEIWRQHLPPVMVISRAREAVRREDYAVASALVARLGYGYVPDSIPARFQMAEALVKLAQFHSVSGEFADAEYYLRWAILQSPKQAVYYNGLGNTLAGQGHWEEAMIVYQATIQLDPKEALYYIGLAQTLTKMGKTEQAILAAWQALELDPNNASAQRLLQKSGQDGFPRGED